MARYYNPAIGKFVSEDPLKYYANSFTGSGTLLDAWHRYSYVNNKPLLFVDPLGYDAIIGGPSTGFAFAQGSCGTSIALQAKKLGRVSAGAGRIVGQVARLSKSAEVLDSAVVTARNSPKRWDLVRNPGMDSGAF